MSRRKSRSISSTKKIKSSQRGVSRMTVHQRSEETRETCFPSVSPSSKNNWPVMDNDSSSWDRNSRATSSSWPGEMEEVAATRKILKLWHATERNIYGEDEDGGITSEPPSEECNQWRSQLIHLRIVGRGAASSSEESNETVRGRNGRGSGAADEQYSEEIFIEDSPARRSQDLSESSRQHRLLEDQRDVLEQILEYVCSEFARHEDENEEIEKDEPSKDLDEVLRITPAPTYSGRKWTNGNRRGKRENGDGRKTSANENHPGLEKSVAPTDNDYSREVGHENDESRTDEPQVARNKLGTVFNEKIVVSPVPFVVSTRESFTTLRTTPISFRAQNFKISSSQGLGRYMNSASMTNSGKRIGSSRIPQIHSAWQAPVCPTVWPKNIKLAPIDPSRLPSSKNNRSSIDSMAALPHRNRNSLSPILRPTKPVISANQRNNNNKNNNNNNNNNNNDDDDVEGLEIQGKQIVTRSSKKNLPKTGWDCSPRNSKNARTKARVAKR